MKLGYLTILVATIAAGCAGTDELEYCEPAEGIECDQTDTISEQERRRNLDREDVWNSRPVSPRQ
jgi:hypothetical protein